MTSSDFRVTLLGTGVPIPSSDRFGPCTLVEAGEQKFLIDAGRGATIRLHQLKIPIGRIDMQLLTHYHSDHTSGIPDVWLTGWLQSYFGTRKTPYRVIGPTGARALMENLERAYALDIKIRAADEKLPLSGIATDIVEFDRDGVVYEKDGVTVVAFEVDHGDVIKPCYGYRFEYAGRTAVFSSDTRYNQNVIKYGAGADLLVHEVASARPELTSRGSSGTIRRRARPAASSLKRNPSLQPIRTLSWLAANEFRRRPSTMFSPKRDKPTAGRWPWAKI